MIEKLPDITQVIVLLLLEHGGVAVAAVSGALVAKSKGMDIFGIGVIAFVTALGGGTLRDLLLFRAPLFWFTHQSYLITITLATIFALVYTRKKPAPVKVLLIVDAFGLAFFAISGAQIAEARHLNWVIVIMMGMITGAAGGVIRDVLCNEIPLILRQDIYATAAIAGSAVYLLIKYAGLAASYAGVAGMITIVIIRILVIYHSINLPGGVKENALQK